MELGLSKFPQTEVVGSEDSLTAFITAWLQSEHLWLACYLLGQKITFLSFTIMEGKKLVFGVTREFFNSRFKMTHLCFPNVMNMICFFMVWEGLKN